MLVPIVALAFAVGYFGISELWGDDPGDVISEQQANAIEPGVSQAQLDGELDAAQPRHVSEAQTGQGQITCLYYPLESDDDSDWEFCFSGDALVTSEKVTGAQRPEG